MKMNNLQLGNRGSAIVAILTLIGIFSPLMSPLSFSSYVFAALGCFIFYSCNQSKAFTASNQYVKYLISFVSVLVMFAVGVLYGLWSLFAWIVKLLTKAEIGPKKSDSPFNKFFK